MCLDKTIRLLHIFLSNNVSLLFFSPDTIGSTQLLSSYAARYLARDFYLEDMGTKFRAIKCDDYTRFHVKNCTSSSHVIVLASTTT